MREQQSRFDNPVWHTAAPKPDMRALIVWMSIYCLVALLLGLYVFRENLDIAWLSLAAKRMLEGGNYTNAFMETNPPMAILVYIPIAILKTWLPVGAVVATYAYLSILIAGSLVLVLKVLQIANPKPAMNQGVFAVLTAALLFFGPGGDLGQREHIGLILIVPFIMLFAVGGKQSVKVNRTLVVTITSIATIGCLIKPTMLLIVGMLIVFRAIQLRDVRILFGLESLIFVTIILLYAFMIVAGVWEYDRIAAYLPKLYSVFNEQPSAYLPKVGLLLLFFLLIHGTSFLCVQGREERSALHVFSVAFLASSIGVLVQQKGWAYHLIPVLAIIALEVIYVFSVLVEANKAALEKWLPDKYFFSIVATFAMAVLIILNCKVFSHNLKAKFARTGVNQVFSQLPANTPVYVFSTDLAPAFPAVSTYHLVWSSRYAHQWILAGLEHLRKKGEQSSDFYQQTYAMLNRTVVEDFERYQPEVVMVDVGKKMLAMDEAVDYIRWYSQSPEFRALWQEYDLESTIGKFAVYRRNDLSVKSDKRCRICIENDKNRCEAAFFSRIHANSLSRPIIPFLL